MSKTVNKRKIKKSKQDRILDIIIYIFAFFVLFITIYPFYYVMILSFNEGMDANMGGIYWLPRKFTLDNYAKFFRDLTWLRAAAVTIGRTGLGTICTVLFTAVVAYGMSFKDLVGRKSYMKYFIVCMYFSGGIIPYYMLLKTLGLLNSFWVYIIPSMLSIFYITIGRGFYEGIPASLRESALIDGASELQIFVRIIVPISKPFLATLALFTSVGHWNNWYDSTFFVKDQDLVTLPYKMLAVINTNTVTANDMNAAGHAASTTTSISVQLAALVISVVPIICVYPFLQKYFVTGLMIGAVKE